MPELTFLKTIGGTTVLRIFSITDYPQLCKFFLLPLPHSVPLCNPKKIPFQNVNSTIQGLYQRSCWYSPFFIYPLRKERRFPYVASLHFYRYLGIRQWYHQPVWWCSLVLHVGCCACPGDCLRFHSAPLWRWWPQKLNHNIQSKGGVPMTGEGILFCFSMLFLILFLLGSC